MRSIFLTECKIVKIFWREWDFILNLTIHGKLLYSAFVMKLVRRKVPFWFICITINYLKIIKWNVDFRKKECASKIWGTSLNVHIMSRMKKSTTLVKIKSISIQMLEIFYNSKTLYVVFFYIWNEFTNYSWCGI